ncbi:Ku protein [Glycomyces sp. YM15]|uniref:non-homologous end joining protein Ku n=1 Tax=Glycomyces sp. YM15 TaxID=2800446 RepID=UPI00196235B9|nr:Ku protein [Glycomyces sp. YM15]
MPRSILNTTLEVGLVRVPVKVYSATGSHDRTLNQFHASDGGRIRYEKVCEIEDEPVDADQIRKGYETDDGDIVLLENKDFESLPAPSSKTIEVVGFIDPAQIDPIHYEKPYYLGPGTNATNSFIVLRDAMVEKGRVALAMFTLRARETLAVIRPYEQVLVLDTLLWADEIRNAEVEGTGGAVDPKEMELARLLIDARTTDTWNPEQYQDDYQRALNELIAAKSQGREAPKAPAEKKAEVVDIMDALRKSVEQAAPDRLPPATARKATVKKAAKKAVRKKSAKKTAKAAAPKRSDS